MDGVELEFTDEALRAVATKAREQRAGARGLRSIIERAMLDVMYEIPSDDDIAEIHINEETILEGKQPVVVYQDKKEAS
jgi:ATP-dependent Clp protease ATP-binding subunit ClpX